MNYSNSSERSRYEQDRLYYYVVSVFINAKMLVDMVRYAGMLALPKLANYVEILRNALYIFCTLYMFFLWFRYKVERRDFLVLCIAGALWFISGLIEPGIMNFAGSAVLIFFSRVFVGYFYFANTKNYDRLCELQKRYCLPTMLYAFMVFQFEQSSGYIAVSYNLIVLAMVYLFIGLNEKNFLYSTCAVIITAVVLLYGSRGSVMCGAIAATIYMAIKVIRTKLKIKIKEMLLFGMMTTAIIVVAINFNQIASALLSKYSSSRTLQMFLAGHITSDSGRTEIYSGVLEAIKNEPLWPHGLLSDRIVVAKARYVEANYLTYPHNYIYELAYQFGLPMALVFLLLNAILILKWLRRSIRMDDNSLVFCMSFIPIAFSQLFVSSSYLLSYMWGIAMGMLTVHNNKTRKRKTR